MEPVEYHCRNSLVDQSAIVWRAYPDRMEYGFDDGAKTGVVPYANVRKVRLSFSPGRFQQRRFVMELTGQTSHLVLTNLHYVSIGNFENRSGTFFPLVRAVVEGVHRANPSASFRAGQKPVAYIFLLAFVIAALALLVAVVVSLPLVPGNVTLSAIAKLAVIAFSLPLMYQWTVRGFPRRFDPATDLDKVLSIP